MIRLIIDDEPVLTGQLLRLLGVPERLDGIEQQLTKIIQKEKQQMAKTSELLAAVQAQTTVIEGVGTFIAELKAKMLEQGIEQADIDAAFEGVNKNTATAALFVNTPTPLPEPVV